jgi:hypothetical protein
MPRIRTTPTLHRSFEIETLMRVFAFASVRGLAVFSHLIPAQSRTFGGYVCSHECELHSAGYKWARDRSIDDKRTCPYGVSRRFTRDAFCMFRIRLVTRTKTIREIQWVLSSRRRATSDQPEPISLTVLSKI